MHPNPILRWATRSCLVVSALLLAACNMVVMPPEPEPEPYMADATVVASGLYSPRQLFYAEDGTLYIAEAGRAGDAQIQADPENIVAAGLTSQITAVSPDGVQSVVLPGLPSIQTNPYDPGFRGGQAIYVTDESYWVGFGEGPPQAGVVGLPFFRRVVEFDRESWRVKNVIDTLAGAMEAGQPEPEQVNSDPTDIVISEDGTVFIVDAGCNCLWSWTAEGGLELAASWTIDDNPVPTGVSIGPDGDIYVSFLSGFPFEAGSARIERWRAGELVQTYGGLTLATDVLVTDDGTIYAVQIASGFGDQGFLPDSGSVVEVSDSGVTPVLEGLRTPYAVAQAPDGSLVVSLVSAFDSAGNGLVIKVE